MHGRRAAHVHVKRPLEVGAGTGLGSRRRQKKVLGRDSPADGGQLPNKAGDRWGRHRAHRGVSLLRLLAFAIQGHTEAGAKRFDSCSIVAGSGASE